MGWRGVGWGVQGKAEEGWVGNKVKGKGNRKWRAVRMGEVGEEVKKRVLR